VIAVQNQLTAHQSSWICCVILSGFLPSTSAQPAVVPIDFSEARERLLSEKNKSSPAMIAPENYAH
jgi:hypothetical protein